MSDTDVGFYVWLNTRMVHNVTIDVGAVCCKEHPLVVCLPEGREFHVLFGVSCFICEDTRSMMSTLSDLRSGVLAYSACFFASD